MARLYVAVTAVEWHPLKLAEAPITTASKPAAMLGMGLPHVHWTSPTHHIGILGQPHCSRPHPGEPYSGHQH